MDRNVNESSGTTGPLRVNIEDLDIDWYDQRYRWQDQPFTGVAYEMHPDGTLVAETEYRDGFARTTHEWYGPGQPRYERHFGQYGPEGMAREWHSNGRLKSESLYEYGILVSNKEWDERGNLTQEHRILETDPEYAKLRERRL